MAKMNKNTTAANRRTNSAIKLTQPTQPDKPLSVTVDDGTQEITIKNKYGKVICNIYIRPTDLSILDRYEKFQSDFEKIVEPLQNISIERDGTASFEKDWEVIKSVEAEIKKRFNDLFDMDEADDIFATRNAFASVHGNFYCFNVLNALGGVIVDAINTESDRVAHSEKVNKYLTPPADTTEDDAGDAGVFTNND